MYQIYPRSFFDENGDGVGDLRGVIGKLDYLRELGVETLWLSPFFESPQADFGYDVRDYYAIAPEYGTLEDCRALIREVHARGMKVVFDMVLNHTSNTHPWFVASRRSREDPKRDFYIWRPGRRPGGKAPPNNWRSMLGGTGWRYDEATDEWYFASFLEFQPDLNYRNPAVKAAMLDTVRHWLREGVDGLRLDIFNALFKDESFADNPFSWRAVPSEDNPHGFFQRHVHTIDHPDTIAFARELRAVLEEFGEPARFLVGEVFGDAATLRRYCGEVADGLHLVFLFATMRARFDGRSVRALVEDFERHFPEPFSPTYVFGNHDRPRFIHRLGNEPAKAKLLAALQLTVRGVPFIYYGEEIGMFNHDIPLHEALDPIAARYGFVPQWLVDTFRKRGILLNRDECRAPMQWSAAPHGGFSSATPWLPAHPTSPRVNVAAQRDDPASLLSCYRRFLALRRGSGALQGGSLEWIDDARLSRDVVAYRRSCVAAEGSRETVDVFLNFSRRATAVFLENGEERDVVSTESGARLRAREKRVLLPYEGVVVTASRSVAA